VAIRWQFQFTFDDGSVRTLDEVAWQVWNSEKLQTEQFFYDPRQLTGT